LDKEIRQLILEAQTGDANAFQKLVALHDERIMTLAYQLTRNPQDAEDLYQEVFIKAYRSLKHFQFKSEFYTWLYRITVNTFYNLNRKLSKYKYQEEDGLSDSLINQIPDEEDLTSDRQEVMAAVKDAAQKLPVKQKTVFMLKHLQGLKIREIAVIMDIGEGTVKKYLFRTMEKLRQELEEYRYA
jgi:RNA polymerase sigma-70 factor (ECF subfamily)